MVFRFFSGVSMPLRKPAKDAGDGGLPTWAVYACSIFFCILFVIAIVLAAISPPPDLNSIGPPP